LSQHQPSLVPLPVIQSNLSADHTLRVEEPGLSIIPLDKGALDKMSALKEQQGEQQDVREDYHKAASLDEIKYLPSASTSRIPAEARKVTKFLGVSTFEGLDAALLGRVLKAVSAHKYAGPFLEPVSQEEAPDYDQVIRRRMDLATIKNNMEDGAYISTEFVRDLLLVFGNAMVYNPKGSDVYVMAATLKKFAMRELQAGIVEQRKSDSGPRTRHSTQEMIGATKQVKKEK